MRVTFEVPGKPQGKGRPRVTKFGAYSNPKTVAYEQSIRLHYINSTKASTRMLHGPVLIEITADFVPPVSWSKAKRKQALDGEICHTCKPDLDNIVKCLDALNGVAWHDDSQIVGIVARKEYGMQDRLIITIEETT